MFSRRHPFLFFMLIMTAMMVSGGVIISLLVFSSARDGRHFARGEKIGVIEVNGVIVEARQTLEDLKYFREDPSVKAIVLRINSPGGAVGPAQEIYREIRKTASKKKVVASMASMAASGGYYIASATDEIMANPGTITGSIGVIMSYTNLQKLFQKIGLTPVVIKSGEFKDIASPMREMSAKEKQILQDFADDIHQQFINDVAVGRGMDLSVVTKLADGRIYSGQEAKTLGLIDTLGNLTDAVDRAAELAGIKGKVRAVYPPKKTPFSLSEFLTGASLQELLAPAFEHAGLFSGYLYKPGT